MTSPDESEPAAEILSALEEIYAEIKRFRRELRPSDRIVRDLEIDSLATLEMLLALEERFGVSLVDNPRAMKTETVGDLVRLLEDLRQRTP